MSVHARGPVAVAVISLGILLTACDLLDVSPTSAVPPDVATSSRSALEAVLASSYERITGGQAGGGVYFTMMMIYPEVLADNGVTSIPPVGLQAQAANQFGAHMGGWSIRYQAINEANYVIKYAPNLSDADESTRDRLVGEALFLRALNTFDLARIYAYEPGQIVAGWDQGVVLRTEPTEGLSDAEPRARSTVTGTYEQIEEDLLRSIELLSSSGGSNVYFATAGAARALLGRVYLYWERWDDAVIYSSAALSNTSARLATAGEYGGIFNSQPNVESLFEIRLSVPSLQYSNYAMVAHLQPEYFFDIWPSQELLEAHEEGDVRRSLYDEFEGVTYLAGKWTGSVDNDLLDNVPVIRFSEVLLNRAEAYAELGEEGLALADLNALREERGLGPVSASGTELVEAILKERRTELAFEGQRWFDLKRRGMDIPKPLSTGFVALAYSDLRILAPLPNVEVQSSDLLDQNPGY